MSEFAASQHSCSVVIYFPGFKLAGTRTPSTSPRAHSSPSEYNEHETTAFFSCISLIFARS